MNISLHDDGLLISGMPDAFLEMVKGVPECPELAAEAADERLFPLPETTGESELNNDWKSLVHPELVEAFRSARQVVAIDLHIAVTRFDGRDLLIASNHFDAWLSALNQARLAIASAHGLGEPEMNANPADLSPVQQDAAERVRAYGALQELLVEASDLENRHEL